MSFSINKTSRSIRMKIWWYNYGASGNIQQRLRFNDKLSDIANRRALHLKSHRQSAFSELPKRHSELAFLNPTLPRFVVVCLTKTVTVAPRYIALFLINSVSDWVTMVNIPLQRNNVIIVKDDSCSHFLKTSLFHFA